MNIMKFRPFFYVLSTLMILASCFSIVTWGFKKSIDFVGGSVMEINTTLSSAKINQIFSDNKLNIISLTSGNSTLIKFNNVTQQQKSDLETKLKASDPKFVELRFESLGPSLGKELLQKTIIAIILSSISLFIFIGSKFKDFSFGFAAIIAMFHDTFILIGAFSILGHFFGAELDALFVTALLTTLSASVHDTVVTFDRIRELKLKNYKQDMVTLANQAVSEVIVRSINNSMTIIFMLFALVVLGGSTTRWFAMALLIGVVCGTYSSTGVAIPMVLILNNRKKK